MTIGELIVILQRFNPDVEIYVADSPWRAVKVLGVIMKDRRIIIDPSSAEEDAIAVEP